jgi:hypothetical protein
MRDSQSAATRDATADTPIMGGSVVALKLER